LGALRVNQAQGAIDPILEAIKKTADPAVLKALAQGLRALAAQLTDEQASKLLPQAQKFLANTGDEETADAWADIVGELARRASGRDDRMFIGTILEVLKYPTVAGKPTDTLMAALQKRFPPERQPARDPGAAVPWFVWWLGSGDVKRPPKDPRTTSALTAIGAEIQTGGATPYQPDPAVSR
jgi:hypothetical protein